MEKAKANRLLFSKCWPVIFFAVLFAVLLILYLPSFTNPPHVDYWEAFYTFHRADAFSPPASWIIILNHDPWQDGTFRPFSYFSLYLIHKVFGADFIGNHIFNFLMYCLVIVLLYRLARKLDLNEFLTGAFLAIYTFLFSHCDILSLTFHLFVIISFSAFLFGFILYLKFMATGKRILLIPISLLFLFGMYCYEVYVLWPLAVIILSHVPRGSESPQSPREKTPGVVWLMLGLVYFFYLAAFLLSRSAGQTSGPFPSLTAYQIFVSFCSVFFNLFYNGILINVMPFFAASNRFGYWVEMKNLQITNIGLGSLRSIVTWGGLIVMIIIGTAGWILYRLRYFRVLILLVFFMFLYVGNFFVVSLARSTNSNFGHLLVQFRYQYIPNALLVLMVLLVVDKLRRPGWKTKIITVSFLIPVLIVNVYFSRRNVGIIRKNLRPLRLLIANISEGIQTGAITEEARIYIQPGITDYLPPLCWHKEVGKFMDGTYEWFFSKEDINCFVFSRKEAIWILDQPIVGYRKHSIMDN